MGINDNDSPQGKGEDTEQNETGEMQGGLHQPRLPSFTPMEEDYFLSLPPLDVTMTRDAAEELVHHISDLSLQPGPCILLNAGFERFLEGGDTSTQIGIQTHLPHILHNNLSGENPLFVYDSTYEFEYAIANRDIPEGLQVYTEDITPVLQQFSGSSLVIIHRFAEYSNEIRKILMDNFDVMPEGSYLVLDITNPSYSARSLTPAEYDFYKKELSIITQIEEDCGFQELPTNRLIGTAELYSTTTGTTFKTPRFRMYMVLKKKG